MSSIYLTEPPTQGKVLIKTTFGDIDIELWSKEAPLACRNFIQLALEGYYDNTIVHRIVKGFMVQMGDPTGTGTGGKSIWGRPFKDEPHGRIKFNHRGQVAMANENAPNTNQSQFFISLDACEWLDRKHTIFGKVTGNTIFNVLRLGEVEVGGEGGDRPIDELKIKGIEVLWNPFDDIVPRDLSNNKAEASSDANKPEKSKNIKAVKDKKLLSFGADDENEDGDEGPAFSIKMKSSHDTKKSKKSSSKSAAAAGTVSVGTDSTADKLSKYGDYSSNNASNSGSRAPVAAAAARDQNSEDNDEEGEEGGGGGVNQAADFDRMMRSELIKKRQNELAAESAKLRNNNTTNTNSSGYGASGTGGDDGVIMDHSGMQDAANDSKRSGQIKDKTDTFKKLKEDLLRSRRAVNVMMGTDADKHQEESAFKEMVSPLEQRRLKYMKRKSEHGDRSEETMEKLKKFTSTIRTTKQQHSTSEGEEGNSVENYHGQVLEQDERVVDPESEKKELQTWFVGKLKCKKHIDDNYRNKSNSSGGASGSDGRYTDDYVVVDPRNQRGNGGSGRD